MVLLYSLILLFTFSYLIINFYSRFFKISPPHILLTRFTFQLLFCYPIYFNKPVALKPSMVQINNKK